MSLSFNTSAVAVESSVALGHCFSYFILSSVTVQNSLFFFFFSLYLLLSYAPENNNNNKLTEKNGVRSLGFSARTLFIFSFSFSFRPLGVTCSLHMAAVIKCTFWLCGSSSSGVSRPDNELWSAPAFLSCVWLEPWTPQLVAMIITGSS